MRKRAVGPFSPKYAQSQPHPLFPQPPQAQELPRLMPLPQQQNSRSSSTMSQRQPQLLSDHMIVTSLFPVAPFYAAAGRR